MILYSVNPFSFGEIRMRLKRIIYVILFFRVNIICWITLFVAPAFAQTIHFKVVDIEKLKPLSDVKITSSLVPKDVFKTDAKGDIFINHIAGDTIVFTKEFYYPVSISITQKAYDFKHMAEVIMVPSVKKQTLPAKDLQSFEYHFVHDTLGENSQLNITTLEPMEAMQTREVWKGRAFRFTHIDIKGKTEKSADNYNLKK